VRRIAEEEDAAAPEVIGDAMVDVISGEPVDPVDAQPQVLDGASADIGEGERLGARRARIAHAADQAGAAGTGQGKYRKEIGLIEVDVQLAIDHRAAAVDVGDIEHLVGPAGEAGAKSLPHQRTCAVAAGEIARLARLLLPVRRAQTCADALAIIAEAEELRAPLHRHAEALEPLDQQPLVLILREDLEERVARQPLADAGEG